MTSAASERTLYWDFFGPNAGRTAEHFRIHLNEFLKTNGLTIIETGIRLGEGHAYAFCIAEEAAAGPIARSLRPRRMTEERPEDSGR